MKIKREEVVSLFEKHFHFFLDKLNFKLVSVESNEYYFNGKFLSDQVGILVYYEFREIIPKIQFSLLTTSDINPRPGLYTLVELYKNPNFVLQSFYLDEIISFNGFSYTEYFKNATTLAENLEIASELSKRFATNFLLGDLSNYLALNDWLKIKVSNLNTDNFITKQST